MNKNLSVLSFVALFFAASEVKSWKIDQRISNGRPSYAGQFPHYAFLLIRSSNETFKMCSGALISDRWIVTVAYCFPKSVVDVVIHMGFRDFQNFSEDGRESVTVPRKNFFFHPEFDGESLKGAVALIKLPNRVACSYYIQPVKLPRTCESNEGTNAIIAGNGKVDESNEVASTLQYADLTVTSRDDCDKMYPFLQHVGYKRSILCAISRHNQAIDRGDGGGGLIRRKDKVLIGIASFVAHRDYVTGLQHGFFDILYFADWISTTTGYRLPKCYKTILDE